MSIGRARVFGISVALLGACALAAALMPACASGETNTGTPEETGVGFDGGGSKDTGGSDGGSKDTGAGDVALFETGPQEVPIGQPCTSTDTCAMGGTCQEITPGATYCTVDCGTGCPTGSYCTTIAGKQLCAPDLGNQCARCAGSIDCAMPTDQCVTAPLGDKFCARDCTALGDCPSGFDCVDATGYPANETGDAGPPGDAGGAPRICVPSAGASCPCNSKRDGVTRTCDSTNSFGTCSGTEHCAGSASAWQGCDARTPSKEICNGVDDDCDGQIDNGNPNDLCSNVGPPPPNATWACSGATSPPSCQLGTCSPGWTDYPVPVDPKTGCVCPVDSGEPNNMCAQPTNLGTIADNGAATTVTGTLSSDGDVDVYVFTASDTTNAGPANVFHVSIALDASITSGEFLFDVIHSGTCVDSPTGGTVGLTSYDWCVNGASGGRGENPCGLVSGEAHCTDHSSAYYLRVYRKAGFSPPTCSPYKINITAAGGTCDFTGTCEG